MVSHTRLLKHCHRISADFLFHRRGVLVSGRWPFYIFLFPHTITLSFVIGPGNSSPGLCPRGQFLTAARWGRGVLPPPNPESPRLCHQFSCSYYSPPPLAHLSEDICPIGFPQARGLDFSLLFLFPSLCSQCGQISSCPPKASHPFLRWK